MDLANTAQWYLIRIGGVCQFRSAIKAFELMD